MRVEGFLLPSRVVITRDDGPYPREAQVFDASVGVSMKVAATLLGCSMKALDDYSFAHPEFFGPEDNVYDSEGPSVVLDFVGLYHAKDRPR